MESEIYTAYKPLRNHLRKVDIKNAFYVIWAYINFFQFDNHDFPSDIQVDESVPRTRNLPNRGILEWELSLLAREVVVNGQEDFCLAKIDLREWRRFSETVNKLKEFENKIWPVYGNSDTLLKELRRVAHRQFPWQSHLHSSLFVRYYKIYNNPRIRDFVTRALGLSLQQWYIVGTTIIGALLGNSKFSVSSQISILGLTEKEFNNFLNFTSADLFKLKSIIKENVSYDDEIVYSFNPLEFYPLVKIGERYYCPVINFLVWRITSGIFYDLIDSDKGFGDPFGLSFQDYLEDVSETILDSSITETIPESEYVVDGKKELSIDLILSQKDCALFIEAKAKRLRAKAKSQILSDQAIRRDLDVIAQGIGQAYATIDDYVSGGYSHFSYNPDRKIFLLLVTLEEWYVFGEDTKILSEIVKQELGRRNLSLEYESNIPYTVCSTSDFEILVQLLNVYSIEEIMEKWQPTNEQGHNFGNFLRSEFKGKYKTICEYFPEDFDLIYRADHDVV